MTSNGRTCFRHWTFPWSARILTITVTAVVAEGRIEGVSRNFVALLGNTVLGGQSAQEGPGLTADAPHGCEQTCSQGSPLPVTSREWDQMTPDSPAHSHNTNLLSICYVPGAGVRGHHSQPCRCREDCLVREGALTEPSPTSRQHHNWDRCWGGAAPGNLVPEKGPFS